MIKTIAVVLIAFLSVYPVAAQKDPMAEKILSHLTEKTKSLQPFHIVFYFTAINLQDKSQNSFTGELTMSGEKYHLKTGDSEIFFNGKNVWNYLPDVNEVNILTRDPEDHSFLARPQQLFSDYRKTFKYHFAGNNEVNGKKLQVIDLYPISLYEEYSRIRLQIDKDKSLLFSARYFGKNGMQYIVRIEKIEHLKQPDPSVFTFKEKDHPGVEIIDLREKK